MKRNFIFITALFLLISSCSLGLNKPGKKEESGNKILQKKQETRETIENNQTGNIGEPQEDEAVNGYLIVKTLNSFGKEELEKSGFEVKGKIAVYGTDYIYWYLHKENEKNILELANSIEGVLSAEYDYYTAHPQFTTSSSAAPVFQNSVTAASAQGLLQGGSMDDPELHNSDYALAITRALEAYEQAGYGENETVLAILDSGINMTHEEFKDENGKSIVLYAKSCAASNGGSYVGDGRAFADIPIGENWDSNGHGSHCTGIMSARGNNGRGRAGAAWKNTKIISYQVFIPKQGGGSSWAVYGSLADLTKTVGILRKAKADRTNDEKNALPSYLKETDFQITQKTVPVNMSLGGSRASEFALFVLTAAIKEDILPVVSMGNNGIRTSAYPAAFPGVLAVGATNGKDKKLKLSTSGEWISISAPGSGIKSCWTGGSNYYQTVSGSSMSAAFVTGAIGYLLSFDNARSMSPYEIKNLLEKTADKIDGQTSFSPGLGHGRVNLLKAAKAVKENSLPQTDNPYSTASVKIVFKNKGIPCRGALTLLDERTRAALAYISSEGEVPVEIKGLAKGNKYSVTGTFAGNREKKEFTMGETEELVEFNFNENLIWVSVVKNTFYNGGNDKPFINIAVLKADYNGKGNEYYPLMRYTNGKFKSLYFIPEPQTSYYVQITAPIVQGQFLGGNYAVKISDTPLDIETGINLQDGARADDAAGQIQNDSHEYDDRYFLSRRKENAWNKVYACNLVSPGTNFYGQIQPDADWFFVRPFADPAVTLAKPDKPNLEPKSKGLTVSWNAVPGARYYLVVLYDENDKIVGTGLRDAPRTSLDIRIGVNEKFAASVQALGNLKDENDSLESEKSDFKIPLP